MSHNKERTEKSCLNCNAALHGKFCSVCGQQNVEPQETVWHLIRHFFEDITHFDGKFFTSVKYVILKPGYLASEYMAGRRMSYLNPVRFYVFTSFLFFLLVFSVFLKKDVLISGNTPSAVVNSKDSLKLVNALQEDGMDSMAVVNIVKKYGIDSLVKQRKRESNNQSFFRIANYKNRAEYDSLKKIKKISHGFLMSSLLEKQFELDEKFEKDPKAAKEELFEKFLHKVPQVLLMSLPFFALLLKLLYVRQKKFYYVSHIIFTIHFYIFVYIAIVGILTLKKLGALPHLHFLDSIRRILVIIFPLYLYKAVRYFYEQGRGKTILKLFILSFALLFLMLFFMFVLFGLTIF